MILWEVRMDDKWLHKTVGDEETIYRLCVEKSVYVSLRCKHILEETKNEII